MSLKRQRKKAGEEDYDYWSLVRTVRTARGRRHEIVARLGKLDGVEQKAACGWHDLDAMLERVELLGNWSLASHAPNDFGGESTSGYACTLPVATRIRASSCW